MTERDAAQLLLRLFEPVARLLWPFFVSGFVARGCLGAELGPLFAKKPRVVAGSIKPAASMLPPPPGQGRTEWNEEDSYSEARRALLSEPYITSAAPLSESSQGCSVVQVIYSPRAARLAAIKRHQFIDHASLESARLWLAFVCPQLGTFQRHRNWQCTHRSQNYIRVPCRPWPPPVRNLC